MAELIRREMGAQRISGRQLAEMIGKSANYTNQRIGGTKPLDLNDLDEIARALGLDVILILEQAERNLAAKGRDVVNLSDYRRRAENVSGAGDDATVHPLHPDSNQLTAEEAHKLIQQEHKKAAHERDGRDEEQNAEPHP